MYLLLLLSSLLLSARYTCGISETPSARIASNPLVPAGQAGPAPSQQGVDKWTIADHRIACNQAQCMYSFEIFEDPTNQPLDQQVSTHCEFLVDAAALPANRTAFQDKACGGDEDGDSSNRSYTVNGNFMNTSSIVLCFTNSPENRWAFFGFDPWEFLSGPPKTSPAYPIGWFGNNTNNTGQTPVLSRRDHLLSRRDSHVWKFLSGTRG